MAGFLFDFEEFLGEQTEIVADEKKYSLWQKSGDLYAPITSAKLVDKLQPGMYKIDKDYNCTIMKIKSDDIHEFKDSIHTKILKDVEKFWSSEENFKNASQVVKSLRAYHKQYGDYPVSLNVLVPDYIAEVPVVYLGVWPRSFEYEYIKPVSIRNDDAKLQNVNPAFYIEYNGYLGVKYTFLSHEKSWKLDD